MHEQRQKTLAVVTELERSLATWIQDRAAEMNQIPAGLRETLIQRWKAHGGEELGSVTPQALIAECYLNELLDLLVVLTADTANASEAKELRQLAQQLQLATIRNVVAHPVRPFRSVYWYRVAAIATDPLLLKLGVPQVAEAVIAAEQGRFARTVQDRAALLFSTPAHNLPETLPHDLTGLVGRESEVRDLLQAICKRRLRAVIVHGFPGSGKTAVLTEALRRIVADDQSFSDLRAVYIMPPSASSSVENLGQVLRNASVCELAPTTSTKNEDTRDESLIDRFGEDRVILALEDLDLLYWRESELIENWLTSLPSRWQVIITSNTAPSDAPCVELGPLSPSAGERIARHLLRSILPRIDEEVVRVIAHECDFNPGLSVEAVRRFDRGQSPSDAARTARNDELMRTFQRYAAHLTPLEVLALESAFVLGSWFGVERVSHLMQVGIDQAHAAFESLRRTPLIDRRANLASGSRRQEYSLSDLAAYALLRQPLDLKQRRTATERNRKVLSAIAGRQRPPAGDPYGWDAVSPDEPAAIRDLVGSLANVLQSSKAERPSEVIDAALSELLSRVEALACDHPHSPVIYRVRALILDRKGDAGGSLEAAKTASSMLGGDPPSALIIASHMTRLGQLRECQLLLEPIVDSHLESPETERSPSLLRFYLRTLERLGLRDELLHFCDSRLASQAAFEEICDISRARGAALISEGHTNWTTDPTYLNGVVLRRLSELFKRRGYSPETCQEIMPLIFRLPAFLADVGRPQEDRWPTVQFLSRHIQFIVTSAYAGTTNLYGSKRLRSLIQAAASVESTHETNPFQSGYWTGILNGNSPTSRLLREGWIESRVKALPRNPQGAFPAFLVSSWLGREDFFVAQHHIRRMDGAKLSNERFLRISRGERIFVKPDWSGGRRSDQATKVLEAIYVPEATSREGVSRG